jgi:uncharacterized protein (TIGR03437 family)
MASSTVAADMIPLPTTLGGAQVQVKDALGVTRNAPLFFVSPAQINFQVPPITSNGTATVTVVRDGTTVGQGTVAIETVTPGLFAANANAQGVAAALILRVKADNSQSYEPVAQFNVTANRYEAVPIDFGAATDLLFLVGYGTGLRQRSALSAVTCTVGGTNAEVGYAGAQGSLTGLDQVNVLIPRSLIGRGEAAVALTVDGKVANPVTINVK